MKKAFCFIAALTLAVTSGFALDEPAAAPLVGKIRLPVLSYTINQSGRADGAHPKHSDTITVDYELTLSDGQFAENSE